MTPSQPGLFGVVEGFYGRPWSAAQRRRLFGWLRAAGLNAFMYAPKDDFKHRTWWRALYDDAESAELRSLIQEAANAGVAFIYALAPGLDITASREADLVALEAKFGQMRALGCTHFAMLWDDIPAELSAADRARYRTPAAAQCVVTNRVFGTLRRSCPTVRWLFCPTEYCGRFARPSVGESAYLREVGAALHPDIEVLWTGPEIVSEVIPVETLRALREVLRRPPVLWDNLVANDYDLRRLYLGPYSGRAAEVRDQVRGVLLNPNCPFEANFVAVHTLGQYLRPGLPPASRVAYREALRAWLPSFVGVSAEPIAEDDLVLLGDCFYLPTELGERAQQFLDDLTCLLRTPPEAWGETVVRFEQTSRAVGALFDKLTALRDREVLHAVYPHVWELKETALLLQAWVRWRQSEPPAGSAFASPEFRPKIHRGGLAAMIERLLPMDDAGQFRPSVR